MKTPNFWHDRSKLWGKVLDPLGPFYQFGSKVCQRLSGSSYKASIPVICVGNVIAGGTGKTPVALALGKLLQSRDIGVHFLSRGYGGKQKGPLRVNPQQHTANDVGDEPLLLAEQCPTWVSRNRAAGARAAMEAGAQMIIMDDGFQNRSLIKDMSLLVVDGEYGFGNGRLLPAGPLREPVSNALRRSDAVIMIGKRTVDMPELPDRGLTIIKANIKAGPEAAELEDVRVIGFAGIGRPAKFFKTLRATDCDLRDGYVFADHHLYKKTNITHLKTKAKEADAILVTTAKDAARLSKEDREGIKVLTISLEWETEKAVISLLKPLLPKRKKGK